jgi:hypothetical protein
MAVKRRKGQVFSLAAILFSGLVVLAMLPSGPSIQNQANNRESFQQIASEKTDAFNAALSENKSVKQLRENMYQFNRFNDLRSGRASSSYRSVDAMILPAEGKALVINYRPSKLNYSLYVADSWINQTLDPRQYNSTDFTPGNTDVRLEIEPVSESAIFNATRPRHYYWLRIESDDETWENSFVG